MTEASARRELKLELLAELARVNRALSAPARIELLELLAQSERSVEVLADLAGLSVANASQHLRVLRRSGLVVARRDGQFVRYRLPGPGPIRLLAVLHEVASQSSPALARLVDAYRRHKNDLEPVGVEELQARSRAGLITVLDVRPAEEFAAGHIPGAINIPLAALEEGWRRLPVEREVVAYCRGVLCIMATEAASRLRDVGVPARRLAVGFPEWRASGLPVETGSSSLRETV